MKFIKKTFNFIRKYLFKQPVYVIFYALNYFRPNFVPEVNWYYANELVDILKSGKSLIRFGDGEIYIANGGSIGFQDYDKDLAQGFKEIIKNYHDKSNYVIAINKIPLEKTNQQLRKNNLLHCWLPFKVYWQLYFNKTSRYFDAAFFYYNESIPVYLENYFKTKKLIIITNQQNVLRLQNNPNLPFDHISYVISPSVNAMKEFMSIKTQVEKLISCENKDNFLVLASMGPASKLLAYKLALQGITVIDVGRGIEIAYSSEKIEHIIYPPDHGILV